MKYDYTVSDIYGIQITCSTFFDAVHEARKLLNNRSDCDPIIDQYYKDDELTGEYWVHKNGKWVKPKTLKELMG